MNICLATRHSTPAFMPLALLYLKAHLVHHGGVEASTVTIAEFDPEVEAETIAEAVLAARPDIVGLSCYVWNGAALLEAARRIKAARPEIKIVLGGPEVGPVAESALHRHPYVDAIVRSEGEDPLCDLVARWRDGRPLADVGGVTYREGDRVIETPDAPIVRDLNTVTSPHALGYIDHTDRVICLETQRGCVFTCNFCFYNKGYSIRNRRFDLDRVKEEILFWLGQDVREIYLMDPVFNLNSARAKDICRFIAEHNHRRVPFHTEVWAEFIDDEMARLFKEAHFKFIEVGLQTTDTAVLELVERRLRLQQFLDGIGFLKKYDLNFELQLIAGLPGETVDSFRVSLNAAAELDPPELAAFRLMILPGTELWRKAAELEIVFDPEPPYYVRSHPTMSAADITHVHALAKTTRALWPYRVVRWMGRTQHASYSDLIEAWLAWHGGPASRKTLKETLPAFIEHYCAVHGIASQFFLSFAALELKDRPAASATQESSPAGPLAQKPGVPEAGAPAVGP